MLSRFTLMWLVSGIPGSWSCRARKEDRDIVIKQNIDEGKTAAGC